MAAITGFMEETDPDLISEPGEPPRGLAGFGKVRSQASSLAAVNTKLARTFMVRSAVEYLMQGIKFQHVVEGGDVTIYIVDSPFKDSKRRPLIPTAAGVPMQRGSRDVYKVPLWSTGNSKMDCPVFDLPAGGTAIGGTCPGANAGQVLVPASRRHALTEAPVLGLPMGAGLADPGVRLEEAICGGCISGDALIMVQGEGLRRIDSMLGRDFVVWSGKSWQQTRVQPMGEKAVVHLALTNGQRLTLTPDHRVLVAGSPATWVSAAELDHEQDLLPVELPEQSPFPEHAPTRIAEQGEPYRTEKRGHLPENWSRGLGVFLGYIVGDGSFSETSEYPHVSLVGAARDLGDIERLAAMVSDWTGSMSEPKVKDGLVSLAWRSKSLTHLLRELGLKKEGEHTRVPHSIWAASEAGVAGFLSGLFSTDGSIGVTGGSVEVSFASTSLALLDEVQQLLLAFGIRTSRTEYRSNRERGFLLLEKLAIRSKVALQRFREKIGFFNARKQALFLAALKRQEETKGDRRTNLRIAAIEDLGKTELVYDLLNVGPEAQFVVNGISVHNCYATGGNYAYNDNAAQQLLRLWWVRAMLGEQGAVPQAEQARSREALAQLIAGSLLTQKFPAGAVDAQGASILPVRLHSSGDFFDFNYARMWLRVAELLWNDPVGRSVRFWAPTRTWAAGWGPFWAEALSKAPPNFMVRASAYHFDDPAPGAFAPGNALGTTSMWATDVEKATARAKQPKGFFAQGKETDFFDWQCPAYAVVKDADGKDADAAHSCTNAVSPGGAPHCRACWTRPDLRISYTAH